MCKRFHLSDKFFFFEITAFLKILLKYLLDSHTACSILISVSVYAIFAGRRYRPQTNMDFRSLRAQSPIQKAAMQVRIYGVIFYYFTGLRTKPDPLAVDRVDYDSSTKTARVAAKVKP